MPIRNSSRVPWADRVPLFSVRWIAPRRYRVHRARKLDNHLRRLFKNPPHADDKSKKLPRKARECEGVTPVLRRAGYSQHVGVEDRSEPSVDGDAPMDAVPLGGTIL